MSAKRLQQRVLAWFDLNGRKNLPWQHPISPYRVWLSEVMLQQTQVTTVIPYFKRFLHAFPDIDALALAPLDAVLHLWAGLGYYARARNLHKTAKIISAHGGMFPDELHLLVALPGIGRSTAGAILSLAFNQCQPILDGNVRRVLTRHYAISGIPSQTKINNKLWALSTFNTPAKRTADYNQAMMDLGSILCTKSNPQCSQCPIQQSCVAKIENKICQYPEPKPAKSMPIKRIIFLILEDNQRQFLLEKRHESGIWGGLWSFMEFVTMAHIATWSTTKNIPLQVLKQLIQQRHTFSHYHLDYTAVLAKTVRPLNHIIEDNRLVWHTMQQTQSLGLPTPIKKLLEDINNDPNN